MHKLAIAEGLTRDGIPSLSVHDPARNSHRVGVAWPKGAVRAIVTNPRYQPQCVSSLAVQVE
jgi:hypothetical protein